MAASHPTGAGSPPPPASTTSPLFAPPPATKKEIWRSLAPRAGNRSARAIQGSAGHSELRARIQDLTQRGLPLQLGDHGFNSAGERLGLQPRIADNGG